MSELQRQETEPHVVTPSAFGSLAKREMLEARSGIRYAFPEIRSADGRVLRSAAAASVDAIWQGGAPDWSQPEAVQLIRRDLLVPCPFNPRRFVSREAMAKTLESVSARGLHTPLEISEIEGSSQGLVLSGHRRLWVAHALDLDLLPCKLDPRGVLSEIEVREAVIRYNEGQEKPAPIDRAQSLFEYIRSSGANQTQVAALFNLSPSEVCNMLRLLTLPEEVKGHVNSGRIPVATALVITRHPGGERAQLALAEQVVKDKLSTRQVRDLLSRMRSASALGVRARVGQARSDRSESHRQKNLEFSIPGLVPATVSVSSKKAELNPEQVEAAITEALNHIPVEFEVHHLAGSEGGAVGPSSPLMRAVAEHQTNGTSLVAPVVAPVSRTIEGRSDSTCQSVADGSKSILNDSAEPTVGSAAGKEIAAAAASIRAKFFGGVPDWSQPTVVQMIHRSHLVPHPDNPRKLVAPSVMESTLNSIRESGIHTPLHITRFPGDSSKAYVLGGHRRLWCATRLNLDFVPCRLDARGVLSGLEVQEALIRDNEGQERPAPVDRAISYAEYLRSSGFRVDIAARRLGTTVAAIERSLQLLDLPPAVQDLANTGQLSEGVALAIGKYPGSSEARVALALRAVTRRLSVAQIKKFIGESRVSLEGLTKGSLVESTTDRVWVASGDKRIVVRVHAGSGALSRGELRDALRVALKQVGELRGESSASLGSSTAADAPVGPNNSLNESPQAPRLGVPLQDLRPQNLAQFQATVQRYLPRFAVVKDGSVLVAPDIALALNRQVSELELKRLGFETSGKSVALARAWYGLARVQQPEVIELFRLLEYWGDSLAHIRSLPPSKREFSYVEVSKLPLDVACSVGSIKRGQVAEQIRSRLELFPEVIERRVLALIDAERMQQASDQPNSVASNEGFVSRSGLELRGLKLHRDLRFYISCWEQSKGDFSREAIKPRDGFALSELHGYYSYALKQLLELSGGGTQSMVGKLQLRRLHIAYCANISGRRAPAFGWQSVFNELRDNLERVALMLQAADSESGASQQ